MAINAYVKDNEVRLSVVFTLNGVDTDPTTVKCFYKDPSGQVTTLTYGVDGALIKDATGTYHADIFASLPGYWFYRFEGSGSLVSAAEAEFLIFASQIV